MPIGEIEGGYQVVWEGNEHKVYRTPAGKYSVYNFLTSSTVKWNLGEEEDAIRFAEQREGVSEIETDFDELLLPSGRMRPQALQRAQEMARVRGLREPGTPQEIMDRFSEMEQRELLESVRRRAVSGLAEKEIGYVDPQGFRILGRTKDHIVWQSPRGRMGLERIYPVSEKRSGITEGQLHKILEEEGLAPTFETEREVGVTSGVSYQMPFPESETW